MAVHLHNEGKKRKGKERKELFYGGVHLDLDVLANPQLHKSLVTSVKLTLLVRQRILHLRLCMFQLLLVESFDVVKGLLLANHFSASRQ